MHGQTCIRLRHVVRLDGRANDMGISSTIECVGTDRSHPFDRVFMCLQAFEGAHTGWKRYGHDRALGPSGSFFFSGKWKSTKGCPMFTIDGIFAMFFFSSWFSSSVFFSFEAPSSICQMRNMWLLNVCVCVCEMLIVLRCVTRIYPFWHTQSKCIH